VVNEGQLAKEWMQRFILERWDELGEIDRRAAVFSPPTARPPIEPDEAQGFMDGIEAGLFSVEPVSTKAGVPEMGYRSSLCDIQQHFFADGARTGKRSFSREAVSQWAAACDLINRWGWDPHAVQIESDDSYSLDFVGFDRDRHDSDRLPLLAGEAKASRSLLEQMIEEMTTCAGQAPESHRYWPRVRTSHRKCSALRDMLELRPSIYLWAVAPGLRLRYWVTNEKDRLTLAATNSPPCRDSR
jgi:hypothetical protein